MSIRMLLYVVAVFTEVLAMSACSREAPPTAILGPQTPVNLPPSVPPTTFAHYRGFIWSFESGVKVIPQPSYAESMVITAINNHGQVVGHLRLRDGRDDYRAFIWSNEGGLQRLGSLVGPEGVSTALVINDDGEVRGLSDGPSTQGGPEGAILRDAFVWTAGDGMRQTNWTRLGDLKPVSEGGNLRMPSGVDCMQVTGASASGLAVGLAGSIQPGICHPTTMLMWELDGTPVVIEQCATRTGCDMGVAGINNRGEVIGYREGLGFRWTRSGGFVQMPVQHAWLIAVNEKGDASGVVINDDFVMKPFVWMASGEIRTIELPAGATSGYAVAINNSGQVTGTYH